jgi:signal transduction histidine kinase
MNKNFHQPALINTTLIICFSFALYGLVIDIPLIAIDLRVYYVAGRLIVAALCFGFFIQVNMLKKQFEAQVPLIYSVIIAYCLHGQYFVNGYYLAFMQAVAGFSLFFAMSKRHYYSVTGVGTLLMLVSVWLTKFKYSEDAVKNLKFNVDTSLGVFLISLICFIGYQKITLAREKKHVLAEKFLDVGQYFGSFVHELKGMTTAPTIYTELLMTELVSATPRLDYLREIVNNLTNDIHNVNERVLSINKLSRNSEEVESVLIRTLIEAIEAQFFFKDNLNITFTEEADIIIGNEFAIRSIVLNLLNNTRENFIEKNIQNRSVHFHIQAQKIVFLDNGGGFSRVALKKIKQNAFFSEKAQGSGMGLFTIREYMRKFNGRVFFKNRSDAVAGVHVELLFNK